MRAAVLVGSIVAIVAAAAQADYYTGFEMPNVTGSAAGTVLSGQEGWYQPVAGGLDTNAYTYAGNSLGFVQNPVGGNQFIGGTSGGGALFPRAQQNFAFGSGTYTMSYDMAAQWSGTGASAANLGSFSVQHDTVPTGQFRQFIALNNFVDMNNPALGWKAEFNVFDAAGNALNNQSPGSFWEDLELNHWYRQYITFDLGSNQILSVTLLDLHTGMSSTIAPNGWYLTGGANSTLALPNGFRAFIGGAAGNTMGWDNVYVAPAPGVMAVMAGGLLFAGRRRR